MALPIGTALAYGLAPALAGCAVGLLLLGPARRTAAGSPHATGPLLVVHAMLATGPTLALAASILATQDPAAPPSFLAAVGVAAGAVCALQGWLGRRGFEAVVRDIHKFGRLLVALALPETLVVVALVGFMVQASAA